MQISRLVGLCMQTCIAESELWALNIQIFPARQTSRSICISIAVHFFNFFNFFNLATGKQPNFELLIFFSISFSHRLKQRRLSFQTLSPLRLYCHLVEDFVHDTLAFYNWVLLYWRVCRELTAWELCERKHKEPLQEINTRLGRKIIWHVFIFLFIHKSYELYCYCSHYITYLWMLDRIWSGGLYKNE